VQVIIILTPPLKISAGCCPAADLSARATSEQARCNVQPWDAFHRVWIGWTAKKVKAAARISQHQARLTPTSRWAPCRGAWGLATSRGRRRVVVAPRSRALVPATAATHVIVSSQKLSILSRIWNRQTNTTLYVVSNRAIALLWYFRKPLWKRVTRFGVNITVIWANLVLQQGLNCCKIWPLHVQ